MHSPLSAHAKLESKQGRRHHSIYTIPDILRHDFQARGPVIVHCRSGATTVDDTGRFQSTSYSGRVVPVALDTSTTSNLSFRSTSAHIVAVSVVPRPDDDKPNPVSIPLPPVPRTSSSNPSFGKSANAISVPMTPLPTVDNPNPVSISSPRVP